MGHVAPVVAAVLPLLREVEVHVESVLFDANLLGWREGRGVHAHAYAMQNDNVGVRRGAAEGVWRPGGGKGVWSV